MGMRVRGGRVKGGTRSVESVVNTQFSGATLTEMMDCSSELALRIGDQFESAGKAEQDRQQDPHLQPIKQQADRFETHLFTPGHGPQRTRYCEEIELASILIKCPSTQCPASVKKASFGWFQGSFLLWWWVLPIRPVAPGLDRDHPLDYVEKEKRS
jgi:hypothetical protein